MHIHGYIHEYPGKISGYGYGYGYGWQISYPRQAWKILVTVLTKIFEHGLRAVVRKKIDCLADVWGTVLSNVAHLVLLLLMLL